MALDLMRSCESLSVPRPTCPCSLHSSATAAQRHRSARRYAKSQRFYLATAESSHTPQPSRWGVAGPAAAAVRHTRRPLCRCVAASPPCRRSSSLQ
ncbi:hypothetical protein E2C01_043491 [Portunus trituberculatus]|uniref:Uncharacterized protein n=1 Tax=Portunus trituberculatus TaxID=210409 RepID=A0A5B7FPL6_PORTR|nr:hypothetical protein [Portunus trituberculatus]